MTVLLDFQCISRHDIIPSRIAPASMSRTNKKNPRQSCVKMHHFHKLIFFSFICVCQIQEDSCTYEGQVKRDWSNCTIFTEERNKQTSKIIIIIIIVNNQQIKKQTVNRHFAHFKTITSLCTVVFSLRKRTNTPLFSAFSFKEQTERFFFYFILNTFFFCSIFGQKRNYTLLWPRSFVCIRSALSFSLGDRKNRGYAWPISCTPHKTWALLFKIITANLPQLWEVTMYKCPCINNTNHNCS